MPCAETEPNLRFDIGIVEDAHALFYLRNSLGRLTLLGSHVQEHSLEVLCQEQAHGRCGIDKAAVNEELVLSVSQAIQVRFVLSIDNLVCSVDKA